MRGIADGAGVDYLSILALNVRTEIAFGMLSDGCTAFSWKTPSSSYLAQNWDWRLEQAQNIICLHITQPEKPVIHMMSEAGIIGKIGLNSAGVGVTLNAIQAKGVDFGKLPCHLALRTVMNSKSRAEAMQALRNAGVASACHIQIADANTGGVGLECTASDIVEMSAINGICTHSNHLVETHVIQDKRMLPDSPFRLERIQELIGGKEKSSATSISDLSDMLKDEKNFPAAICRARTENSSLQTLFSIVMDLSKGYAKVKMGRPTENGEGLELRP